MYQEMADAFYEAEKDATGRAVLLRANGGAFSAGNDLDDFLNDPPKRLDASVFQFLRRISACPKPIVVAVGIGTTMLLHCDMVYATATTKFSLPFAQLGLCPEAASSLLLPRTAGYQRAAEKLLTGEAFDVNAAMAMGFVNDVIDEKELDAYAFGKAKKLSALPASSLRVTKARMKRSQSAEVIARMETEAEQFAQMLTAPEAKEGSSKSASRISRASNIVLSRDVIFHEAVLPREADEPQARLLRNRNGERCRHGNGGNHRNADARRFAHQFITRAARQEDEALRPYPDAAARDCRSIYPARCACRRLRTHTARDRFHRTRRRHAGRP
ncbi:Enoyl-CoA hydratase [Candidatus Burkholderia pumila]|uniref:Enoyl-CoA hydratase n=1 Tax=Candidatus Burkholderia pumila TaxID=1090375 RepID=A0ABR5HKJ3_9BURK|nr:Enoyl-CoA hydratase [Candidatus Burkholderia pumila]